MSTTEESYDAASLPDLLPVYYKRLFPYGPFYRWLNYGGVPKTYFTNREFSFTLKDDVYLRYQSFTDQQDLEKEIQKRCPYKIDIGAVFSHRPKDNKTVRAEVFQAQEKELVFDIDMTDYDDVRSCCSGADICEKCWPLMTMAVKILDRALREDFGFEHILWVYSGRRGVHCWVCDELARKLSQTGRTAIAEYLNLVKGGENQKRKVRLDYHYTHPCIQEALKIVEKDFEHYACSQQDFLGDEKKMKKVLALIPSEELRNQISKDVEDKADSASRWDVLKRFISLSASYFRDSQRAVDEIMLQYCYPRLDVNVSIGVNHLLKSPFCIHPKTGRVCVPMDPEDIDNFSPAAVPTITQLMEELNKTENRVSDETGKRQKDYKSTSMNKSVEVFERFLKKLENTRHGKLQEESDKTMDF
ncbi:DNA primase small subunit-like [Babylonia areolata]|uniref:DNA primase small subunit-like n=1 Tax=Babylonia areolata TaxID=304850 RepID=UPI003FCFD4A0